jgi:hypothetical protein
MIFRRFGGSVQSVAVDFDSKALTEIRFRRDNQVSYDTEEVAKWQRLRGHELDGKAEGWVQDEVEQKLLADLEAQIRRIETELAPDELLLIESEPGTDYPKTVTQQKTVNVEGENKFHFVTTLRPPLRLGIYRTAGGAG